MEIRIAKIEAYLRVFAIILLVLAACLVGFDSQTKSIIIEKTVTYKDLRSLLALIYMDAVAATYNMLQLSKGYLFGGRVKGSNTYMAWICYLLDQIAVYMTFATTVAATEHSVLVVTGTEIFQWMKWCNRFTRFCFQIGGALFCGFTASVLMAFISFLSAFNLFRLYSPKHFLLLKTVS